MKTLKSTLIIFGILLLGQTGFSQLAAVKKFDYSLLEGKKLYLPTYEAAEKYIKKMAKKGKYDKVADAKKNAEDYNKNWKEAMAESSYDATDYEIKAFDSKKLIKSKNKEAILLMFSYDKYGNRYATLNVTSPKNRVIAYAITNGLNLTTKNDIRLMMNILNESLNTAAELEEEGDKSRKAVKNKYKADFIEFYADITKKTFLVPKSEHKKADKAKERTRELKEALRDWTLSEYILTTQEEIEKKRVEGDPDSFYWRDFPVYNNSPFNGHYNMILSTEGDDVLFVYAGKNKMKPGTIDQIQKKMLAKAEKYQRQLGE